MSKLREPYKCDACGKLREKDANHWWLLKTVPVDFPHSKAQEKSLALRKWSNNDAETIGVQHVCGQKCAQELIERWMTTGSFDPPSARPVSRPVECGGSTPLLDSSSTGEEKL